MKNIEEYCKWLDNEKPTANAVIYEVAKLEAETNGIYSLFSDYLEDFDAKFVDSLREIMGEENKHACMAILTASDGNIEDYTIEKDE